MIITTSRRFVWFVFLSISTEIYFAFVSPTTSKPSQGNFASGPPAMARPRRSSTASTESTVPEREQELGSMYDYLAKVILLGPSGAGKSCLLHRFVKNEWRVFTSQTIGVEFASKIVKVGTGSRRKRIKLQLWDTAGTERFRSVSRSYYRGAAGAILVYDVASHASFSALPTFLMDARALASPQLTVILAGNKTDLSAESALRNPQSVVGSLMDDHRPMTGASSVSSLQSSFPADGSGGTMKSTSSIGLGSGGKQTATTAVEERDVTAEDASRWASKSNIPVSVEVSALSGDNVDELFSRLARMILTKIELGEIDPDDPQSGIQYGDGGTWGTDTGSIKSGTTIDDGTLRRRRGRRRAGTGGFMTGLREWEDVFRVSGSSNPRRGGCC